MSSTEKLVADPKSVSMNAAFALDVLLHWPVRQSILLVGDHGIGKDGIVKTAAMIQNIPCVDIRLSQNDVGDIKGMPFRVKGRTVFAPPDWMPFKEEEEMELEELMGTVTTAAGKRASAKRGILFFNEINRASLEVRQAAFEIVLDRTMNSRELRDGWRIVSAVNGDDHYQVNVMDLAFKSRFYVIRFKPSVEEWLTWGENPEVKAVTEDPRALDIVSKPITGPLHPAVLGYIRQHPPMLDPTDEQLAQAEADVALQVPNRRAWHMMSDSLRVREALADINVVRPPLSKEQNSLNYLLLMGMGYVGFGATVDFMNYIRTDYEVMSGDIILNKWSVDVEARVRKCLDEGCTVELSRYNDQIVEIARDVDGRKLSKVQKRNLTTYFQLLNRALRAMLYKNFISEAREACNDWYSDKEVEKLVLEALMAPKK